MKAHREKRSKFLTYLKNVNLKNQKNKEFWLSVDPILKIIISNSYILVLIEIAMKNRNDIIKL